MKFNKTCLGVETLENRWVPAVLLQLDGSGNLTTISGNGTDDVTVTFTAADTVNVNEDGNDLGTYSVPGNLSINLGNTATASPSLTVDLATFSMSGNLSMNLGNALVGYAVTVTNGTVAGNVSLRAGNGADGVNFTTATVNGSVSIDTSRGADAVTMTDTVVDGNVTVANDDFTGANMDVGGHFTFRTTEGVGTTVNLNAASSVAGNVVVNLAAGNDAVNMNAAIGGHCVLGLGNGANSVNAAVGDAFNLLGSATVVGGSGIDTVFFDGTVAGNITATLGSGNDQIAFGGDPIVGGLTMLGSSISVIGGNGNDTAIMADISGPVNAPGARFSFIGGNGNDTVDFGTFTTTGNPALASMFLDGGAGTNDFVPSLFPITFPTVIRHMV